jgi:Mo-co oxidoreductase dimerisation domain
MPTGARSVSGVEVSVDNTKTWHEAHIDYTGAPTAWVLWSYEWRPTQPGASVLVVRATDGTGTLQTAMDRRFAPEGATGYHYITVRVEPKSCAPRFHSHPKAPLRGGWPRDGPRR